MRSNFIITILTNLFLWVICQVVVISSTLVPMSNLKTVRFLNCLFKILELALIFNCLIANFETKIQSNKSAF